MHTTTEPVHWDHRNLPKLQPIVSDHGAKYARDTSGHWYRLRKGVRGWFEPGEMVRPGFLTMELDRASA